MNKIFKNLIIIFVMFCTISTVSFAKNMTNANGVGTVTWDEKKVTRDIRPGSKELPYELVMGEPVIDIYYGKYVADQNIYFEFTSGSINAGNYLIDHNSSKKRIRLTLIGTSQEDLRVASEEGNLYKQAGAITYSPDIEDFKVSKPFYNITVAESFKCSKSPYNEVTNKEEYDEWLYYMCDNKIQVDSMVKNTTSLANSFLNVKESILASNVATYSASYVFSKSNIPYKKAYKITESQLCTHYPCKTNDNLEFYWATASKKEIKYDGSSRGAGGCFAGEDILYDATDAMYYKVLGDVQVIYCFNGTSSATLSEKKAGWLESIISKIFISVGDVFVKISGISGAGVIEKATSANAAVTLDSLIFNEYPNTIVNFFGDTGYTNAKAKKVIEFWFDVFKAWAIIIFIVLLIYIGIKTVLVSGTAEQKKVKGMLEGWLIRSAFIILYAIFI